MSNLEVFYPWPISTSPWSHRIAVLVSSSSKSCCCKDRLFITDTIADQLKHFNVIVMLIIKQELHSVAHRENIKVCVILVYLCTFALSTTR